MRDDDFSILIFQSSAGIVQIHTNAEHNTFVNFINNNHVVVF